MKIRITLPGHESSIDMNYTTRKFTKRTEKRGTVGSCQAGKCWYLTVELEDEGTLYKQEEFLKNYLEDGFVTVEVFIEISVTQSGLRVVIG